MDALARRSSFRLLLAAAAVVLCLHCTAVAQQAPPSTGSTADPRIESLLNSLDSVRTPNTAAISPDGNTVAWTFNGEHGSELHLTRIASQSPAQDRVLSPDTIGDTKRSKPGICTASHPAWSPDGTQLAFLSNCFDSNQNAIRGGKLQPTAQQNIFFWTLATNFIRQGSYLHGEISSLQWSPDGKSIAFLYVENATRRAGATDAMKPWSGVIGQDIEAQAVSVIQGLDKGGNIAVSIFLPSLQRTPTFHITQLHAYEFAWAPDSAHLTFVGAPAPGEDNWWQAKLYTVATPTWYGDHAEVDSPKVIFDPTSTPGPLHGLQIAVPRFSPDGKQIAFIGGLMSDQGSVGGNIYLIPTTGGEPKDVTPNRPASPAYIAWLDDHTIGISEHVGGSSRITTLDLTTGKDVPGLDFTFPDTIIAGEDAMSVSFASHSPNIALIRQSFDRPPEVWAGPSGNLKQITHLNDVLQPAWGKAEAIDYSNDGFRIQGWLLYPANYDPSKKYPLIVSVHGGPSSTLTPRWPVATYSATPFSALGYFVFYPNPRGSFGQGERFTQANIKDFGYGDLRDILAGVNLIEKRFPIDRDREGITGWSYGGFMTMFAVTQTTRFRAAVAGAGIANWQSYYGENSIDQWMLPFFGASVYDDPGVYAKSSPIDFIKNVKTPTLLLVGDRDGECPAPQSFEFWHALRDQGVKTQLVIYPGEGHHFSAPDHQRDLLRRTIGWFQDQMPPN
ncbi:MAG: prolyl oligopeptidase family serine peptidase [Acidobacteriaceae bacterium]